jgi:hypothetical protein
MLAQNGGAFGAPYLAEGPVGNISPTDYINLMNNITNKLSEYTGDNLPEIEEDLEQIIKACELGIP